MDDTTETAGEVVTATVETVATVAKTGNPLLIGLVVGVAALALIGGTVVGTRRILKNRKAKKATATETKTADAAPEATTTNEGAKDDKVVEMRAG